MARSTAAERAESPERVESPVRAAPEPAGAEEKAAATPKKKPVRLIAFVVLALAAGGVGTWYYLHRGIESTDDAQVEADVLALATKIAGVVVKVNFEENQPVKADQVLVELDSSIETAKLDQAEAEIASAKAAADAADAEVAIIESSARGQRSAAEASLSVSAFGAMASHEEIAEAEAQITSATVVDKQMQQELERVRGLYQAGSLPKQQLDVAQSAFDSAEASLQQARAHLTRVKSSTSQAQARIQEAKARVGQFGAVEPQIAQARARAADARARVKVAEARRDLAKIDLINTKVYATVDGLASKKTVVIGQVIGAGQPVAMIVPNSVWVTANFKETQLHKMKVDQPAEVEIDAYPGLKLTGKVESLSGATGSRFSLLPPDNATGNFTKVVQRVPVRIKILDLPEDKVLRPGMSADVTVDERK